MMKICTNKILLLMLGVLFAAAIPATAQSALFRSKVDLAVTFAADRTNPVNGNNQWLKGGGVELGADAWHGFGVAAKVTGLTINPIGSQGVPLSMVVTTFGPRYRFSLRKWSFYGEGLVGEANGFRSVFPSNMGTTDSSNSFVLQVGGGADFRLAKHFAYRGIEAFWTRTQFENGTTNVQNHLQLGTGLVFRF